MKPDEQFRGKRSRMACEDILRFPQEITDGRIVRAVNKLLSPEEREAGDFLGGIVAGAKVILVCRNPKSLREIVLMERKNPGKVYRRKLSLKRQDNPAEA